VTLNIMAASKTAMFLSADFRLTHGRPRRQWYSDEPTTIKLNPWCNARGHALVSFSGFASLDRRTTWGWLEKRIEELHIHSSIEDLLAKLAQPDELLQEIALEDRRLTFCVVGYDETKPTAAIVSNFQSLHHEDLPTAAPTFTVTRVNPANPFVFVGGDRKALLRHEKRQLLRTLDRATDPFLGLVAGELASFNANAASRSPRISAFCLSGYVTSDGRGAITPFGVPEDVEFLPTFVRRKAIVPQAKKAPDGTPLPRRLVSMILQRQPQNGHMFAVSMALRNVEDPPTK